MLPSNADLRKYVYNVKSQNNINCCAASATLHAIEIVLNISGNYCNLSQLYVYYMARKLQGRSGLKGTTVKAAIESICMYGVPPETHWPFISSNLDIFPSDNAVFHAAHNRVREYKHAPINQFKNLILDGIPIVVGIRAGKLFSDIKGPLHQQLYKPINTLDNTHMVDHAVVIVGYDENILGGSWVVLNSIGPMWGDRGFGILPYACNIDICEAYVIRNFAGIPADKFSIRFDK